MTTRRAVTLAMLVCALAAGRGETAAPGGRDAAAQSGTRSSALSGSAPVSMASLWVDPVDLESRDLFYGPGGRRLAPQPGVPYQFEKVDNKGHSRKYAVLDPQGKKWDVKVGDEAQPEIAVSRILWAIGYHQPALYYLPRWRMIGGPTEQPPPGRFRFKSDHKKEGSWAWKENPFVGTRPLEGLLVANLLLNNWDLTTDNNRIYRMKHAGGDAPIWFVVQDVGAGLGGTLWSVGSRNNIRDFESQDFVRAAGGDRVKFDYHSIHQDLLKGITRDDVVWTCRLMARLSDRQLHDAFRAAGYPQDVSDRYVRKIEQKIRQGLALPAGAEVSG